MTADSPRSAQPPLRPAGRIDSIDGLRGAFLLLMTLTHLTVPGGSILKSLHPDSIGFIDSATGFVFLSGLMVGLVYAGVAQRSGLPEAARRLRKRALHLYGYTIALIAMIALGSRLIPGAAEAWAEWAGPITRTDGRSALANLMMMQDAAYADILPMYVLFLLVSPIAIWLCLSGRTLWLLGGSILLWAVTQFGVTQPMSDALGGALAALRPDLRQPDTFNLAAWQLLFVAGLALGAAASQGRLKLAALFDPRATLGAWLSLGLLLAIAGITVGLRMNHPDAWPPGGVQPFISDLTWKSRLGVGSVLNVAAYGYLIAWMLIAGVNASGLLGRASRLFARVTRWPFLTLLGRNSLQVYAWQVVVVYAVKILDSRLGASNPLLNAAIILTSLALLAVPALAREWKPTPRRRQAIPVS